MTREIWGLEIDPPDEFQLESAKNGFSGQLEFTIRIARYRRDVPFVTNSFLREWASNPINQSNPDVARLTFSVKGKTLLMHNLMLSPEGRSLLTNAKGGGIGSLMEIRTLRWLKEEFPRYSVMDLSPTGYRIHQLKERGQPIGRPIPIAEALERIKTRLVKLHHARFRATRFRRNWSARFSRIRSAWEKIRSRARQGT